MENENTNNYEDVVLEVLDTTEAPTAPVNPEAEEVFVSEDTADHIA